MPHQIILEIIWYFLPAGVANTMPVIAARYNWLPVLNIPLDGGLTFRGHRLLGTHKTWRGLILGLIFGSLTGYFLTSALAGALLGSGALAGDALKSFFKRHLNIAPGKSWPIFDQIDSTIGALVVAWFIFPLTLAHIITTLIAFSLASYLVSFVGVKLKIKKSL